MFASQLFHYSYPHTLFVKHLKLYFNGIQTYKRDKVINIIIPIYNEKPLSLLNAIESVKKPLSKRTTSFVSKFC
jgi:hypothetical protein